MYLTLISLGAVLYSIYCVPILAYSVITHNSAELE